MNYRLSQRIVAHNLGYLAFQVAFREPLLRFSTLVAVAQGAFGDLSAEFPNPDPAKDPKRRST